ncbi:MAG: Xaa-Pro peptidase family protein [Negativicutes bacterium]|nr:Xaa-Pro peptidase family protein [Negativicutes bacterium]
MNNRLDRLRALLHQQDLDGVIVAKPENRLYFSGFTGSSGILLISGSQARLITDFRYIEQAAGQAPDFSVVRHGSDIYTTLKTEIDALGLKKVGFEGDFQTWDGYQRLVEAAEQPLPVHLDEVRMAKDADEAALIRHAVLLADNAFTDVLPYLKPGVREADIALELEFHMRKHGAEKNAFDIIVASGKRSALPHGRASAKTIQTGDFVTMDFGAVYQGYHSDITRTVVVGRASVRQREVYNLVLSAQLAGVAAVAPGKTGRECDAVARDIIAAAGFGDYFGHGLGHGVGLAIHEQPRLAPGSEISLTPGMVVTVEPGVYLPDWGGVRIEDTVIVTADGAEILTASSKELIELDW